ncbi:MAG: hypothetical protein WBQ60_02535, partial [Asticcacaulis sp.]
FRGSNLTRFMFRSARLSLFKSSVLSLGVCALALSSFASAEVATPKTPEANPAATGRNADGTLHAPTLEDAPKDDFLRVAWCHGVLSGNMEMAELVDTVMPIDDKIQIIGESYLRAYEAALTLSGKGKDAAQHKKAEDVRDAGYNMWAAARAAPIQEAAGAYANWQLPGDCEHAAVRISGHPNLFAEMATDQEMDVIAATLKSSGQSDSEIPKPILTAQVASTDGSAPIASNVLGRRAAASGNLPSLTPVPETDRETTLPTQTVENPNHVEKRKWSDGLGYRLGWTDKPKK